MWVKIDGTTKALKRLISEQEKELRQTEKQTSALEQALNAVRQAEAEHQKAARIFREQGAEKLVGGPAR